MSSPISAMMTCADTGPMPVISARRSARPARTMRPTSPSRLRRRGRGLGIDQRSRSTRRCGVVRVSIWAVNASIWSSNIRASSAWCSSKRPVNASTSARVLGSHLAARQTGEPTRITFASDQRFEHVAHRHRVHPRHHRRHLDQRVFEQLLHALPVTGALAGQIDPQPGVVPQLPDFHGGTKLGRSMPFSVSLASHTASSLSVFGRPGTFFTSRALTSCTSSPAASSR